MTDSELLRAMGEYILEHGFSPEYRQEGNPACGCFIHAQRMIDSLEDDLWNLLVPVVGTNNPMPEALRSLGWTEGCTEDAAAACFIASDLAAP